VHRFNPGEYKYSPLSVSSFIISFSHYPLSPLKTSVAGDGGRQRRHRLLRWLHSKTQIFIPNPTIFSRSFRIRGLTSKRLTPRPDRRKENDESLSWNRLWSLCSIFFFFFSVWFWIFLVCVCVLCCCCLVLRLRLFVVDEFVILVL
jgi:hypothetical protein